ncbi:hypothetical protein [Halorhabdus salina]|uniref:hypothetical protein n=1 Tax=Halorhabdus salina TaxID=2750670 RepID=UPI0015EF7CAF|nr:hypothetical protein [Halorhabdus salina]
MAEEPLVVGAVLFLVGIALNLLDPYVFELTGVSINGWGLLSMIIGIFVIGVRLYSMTTK